MAHFNPWLSYVLYPWPPISVFAGAGLSPLCLPHPCIVFGESLFADHGCSFHTCSSSGLHRSFMNFLHLPSPGLGLQLLVSGSLGSPEGTVTLQFPWIWSPLLLVFSFGQPSLLTSNLCFFLKNSSCALGCGDGSVSKVLAWQEWGPEFDIQNPQKMPCGGGFC